MVIECGAVRRGGAPAMEEGEEEGISLGIPVCEALDLEAIQDTSGPAPDSGRLALRPNAALHQQVVVPTLVKEV
jgi:hypothetical protein